MLFTLVLFSLQLQSQSTLRINSLDTAFNYLFVREQGNNQGKTVSRIIKNAGGKPGQSWCMYFVYYCVDKAAKDLKIENPLGKTGSVAMQLKFANNYFSKCTVIPVANNYYKIKIKRGDILIFKAGVFHKSDIGRYWHGHTGFCYVQTGKDEIISIEGNTNRKGSREGDGVYIKYRSIYNKKFPLIAIIRY